MERLNFKLDDFTRVQWAPGARAVWEPRFVEVSKAWQNIEIEAVAAGIKKSALLTISPEQLAYVARRASIHNLMVTVLGVQGRSSAPYATSTHPHIPGQPFDYRVAVSYPSLVNLWFDIWDSKDDSAIGQLLGYPECCQKFFKKYWTEQGFIDTTWMQACNGGSHYDNVIDVTPNMACNVTLKVLGIRAVSHLPCSFYCKETIEIGEEMMNLIRNLNPTFYETLSQALQWPLKWSALHGIAEITTPVCRIITRTDATPRNYIVRQHGALYPDEGARGVEFPFKDSPRAQPVLIRPYNTWSINGFQTLQAQIEAHNVVLSALGDVAGKTVIDLGCGDGSLLNTIRIKGAAEIHGVDISDVAVEKAKQVAYVRLLNINNPAVFDRDYDVALISVQRLQELIDPQPLLNRLKQHTKETVFYSYAPSLGWLSVKDYESGVSFEQGPNRAVRVVWSQLTSKRVSESGA